MLSLSYLLKSIVTFHSAAQLRYHHHHQFIIIIIFISGAKPIAEQHKNWSSKVSFDYKLIL